MEGREGRGGRNDCAERPQPSPPRLLADMHVVTDSLLIRMIQRVKGEMPSTLKELFAMEASFEQTTIKELAEKGRWSPFVPLDPSSDPSVLLAMVILGKYGISRVCLTESSGDITNVITQTSMVQFIMEKMGHLLSVGKKSIHELGLIDDVLCEDVISVNEDQTYWDAFRVMSDLVSPMGGRAGRGRGGSEGGRGVGIAACYSTDRVCEGFTPPTILGN